MPYITLIPGRTLMTKKDLIEFLKDYPDDTIILCNTGYWGYSGAVIEEWFDRSGKKCAVIGRNYNDD